MIIILRRKFAKVIDAESLFADLSRKSERYSSIVNPRYHIFGEKVDTSNFKTKVIDSDFIRPPKLHHNLDKIVRTEGIYTIDEFTKLNKDNFIKFLPDFTDELVSRFSIYTPPSKDQVLLQKAKELGVKYITGSSSVTEALQNIYFVLTNFKSPDFTGLGKMFDDQNKNFMGAYKKPNMIMLRKLENGIWAIDGEKGPLPSNNRILTLGGLVMESMFTTDKKVFKRAIDLSKPLSPKDSEILKGGNRSYRFRQSGDILIRSQIDCESTDKNGDFFVFEIKTRASAPIRYDVENYEMYLDYEIKTRSGLHSSYEREYFDLCRSIILKYLFQLKLGRMDGAFVAHHNTKEIFGFEYLKITELERRVFGLSNMADEMMDNCFFVLNDIIEEATQMFPNDQMLKLGIYADSMEDELVTTIERFDKFEEFKQSFSKNPEGIHNIYDYYKINKPNAFAYAFGRKLFPYLNGIRHKEPIFFEPGDKFEFSQYKYKKGLMEYHEYLNFLHNAYKEDGMLLFREYFGIWKKFNDYHVFRRPLHRDTREN